MSRAKAQLERHEAAALFYAALELRSAVEARQLEYSEALEHLQGSKIRHWNIAETHKRLRSNSYVDAIAHMRFEQGENVLDLFHVPVSSELKNQAEKLGDLLHAQAEYRLPADVFWTQLRERLVKIYRATWLVSQGNCLVPPLMDKDGTLHPLKIEWPILDSDLLANLDFSIGAKMHTRIRYLTEAPIDWLCDL